MSNMISTEMLWHDSIIRIYEQQDGEKEMKLLHEIKFSCEGINKDEQAVLVAKAAHALADAYQYCMEGNIHIATVHMNSFVNMC